MHLKLIGINHKTAPIEVREKFYLDTTQQDLLLSELKNHPKVCEAFVLSTCNRTEVYVHLIEDEPIEFIFHMIAQMKHIVLSKEYKRHLYYYDGQEAITHLLKVTTGLDSLILGERQILGQVKSAFDRAREKVMLGKYFNILSNVAIRTGKKAHAETEISAGGSSVSWAAIVMAEKILDSLCDKKVLIMGAGKMSELAVQQIAQKTVAKLYIMNRTQETGEKLAQRYHAISCAFCDVKEILSEVDICICSTDAPHYILDKGTVGKALALRQGRSVVLIDISMPRNIDPQVNTLPGVSLFMLDDLDKIVDENMRKRQKAVGDVERIINRKVTEFLTKVKKVQDKQFDYFQEVA